MRVVLWSFAIAGSVIACTPSGTKPQVATESFESPLIGLRYPTGWSATAEQHPSQVDPAGITSIAVRPTHTERLSVLILPRRPAISMSAEEYLAGTLRGDGQAPAPTTLEGAENFQKRRGKRGVARRVIGGDERHGVRAVLHVGASVELVSEAFAWQKGDTSAIVLITGGATELAADSGSLDIVLRSLEIKP